MSDERIDPETLAAFLEGGLAPAERERVVRALAESPEAYADFVEAAAVAREVDAQASALAAPAVVVPITASKRRRAGWYIAPVLLAAGIAAIVVVKRGGNGAGPGAAITLAQATNVVSGNTGALATTLGQSWDQPPWSVARGGESGAGQAARAFRAGVRYAELEVAIRAGDSAGTAQLTETLARTAETVDAGAPIAAQYRDARTTVADRARIGGQLRSVLGAPADFDAGVWIETGRLCVLSNRLDYFGPNNMPIAELKRLLAELEKSPGSAALVDALRPLVSGRFWSDADKGELARLVDAAIAAGAK